MNLKKNKPIGKNKNFSIARKLQKENKSNEQFEIMLSGISLEEIIALKLELASKYFGGKMFGLPIWHSIRNLVSDALLKYALSATSSKKEAARLLGFSPKDLRKYVKKYKIEEYFEEKDEKNLTDEI